MITYNHVDYIRGAIESVLMQKVNFTWELIIADDYSTDGSRQIILEYQRNYPKEIRLVLQKRNVGPGKNWEDLLLASKSKYIAYFEGDDYWLDPLKLQKQIDFLENNNECGVVFTDADYFYERNGKRIKSFDKKNNLEIPTGNVTNRILYKSLYKTCTVVFQRPNLKDFFELMSSERLLVGDKALWLYLSGLTEFGYLDQSTAVRRVLNDSGSNFKSFQSNLKFRQNSYKVSLIFARRYGVAFDKTIYKRMYLRNLVKYALYNKMLYEAMLYFVFGIIRKRD